MGQALWLITLILLSMAFIDQRLLLFLKPRVPPYYEIIHFITDLGDAGYLIFGSLFSFIITRYGIMIYVAAGDFKWLRKLRKFSRASLHLFYSLLFCGILTILLKFLFGRMRPYGSDTFDPFTFVPFNGSHVYQSFPSGHTQVVFCLFAITWIYYRKYAPYVFIFSFTIALTRPMVFNHFFSDLIFGAAVGFFGTRLAVGDQFSIKQVILDKRRNKTLQKISGDT